MHGYTDWDATELAARIARGELSPAESVEAGIAAIEQVNPRLNAAVHRMYERARAAVAGGLPDGPLRGVPLVVKDFDGFVAGEPWTAGTRFLDGFVADHDSEAIARLRRAGLVFLAKTNLPELALLGTTEPQWRGPTRNPWNTDHTPGGSSGGSAALVAARAVPLGHGGDGGGSLRIPASACALVGLKATRGRVPLAPDVGEGWGGLTSWGVLTRSVRDTAAILDILAGPAAGDPYRAPPLERPLAEEAKTPPGCLRVAWTAGSLYGRHSHPEARAAAESVAALLAELGHHVEEARPEFDREVLARAYLVQVATSTALGIAEMGRWVERAPAPGHFEPVTWFLGQVGRALSAVDLQAAREANQAAGRSLAAFFDRHDVFLCPTVAYPPVRLGELALKPAERFGLSVLRVAPAKSILRKALEALAADSLERTPNTQLFNQTGVPAISLPLHWTGKGLPLGVQLAAPFGDEATLIRLAAQLEQARPWAGRKPPVVAEP